jgi:hypothetical protein
VGYLEKVTSPQSRFCIPGHAMGRSAISICDVKCNTKDSSSHRSAEIRWNILRWKQLTPHIGASGLLGRAVAEKFVSKEDAG